MNKRTSDVDERLLSLTRHLDHLLAQGLSGQDAMHRLRQGVEPDEHVLVDQLALLLEGKAPSAVSSAVLTTLALLVQAAKTQGGRPVELLRTFTPMQNQTQQAIASLWHEFKNFASYLLSILVVVAVCLWIFAAKVFPQFGQFYADFGASLPQVTVLTLQLFDWIEPLFLILVPLLTFYLVQIARLGQQLIRQQPLDRSIRRVPGLRWFARLQSHYLLMLYAHAIRASGVSGEQALQAARGLLEQAELPPQSEADLRLAQHCGTLDQELEYQCQHLQSQYLQRLGDVRQRCTAISHTLLALLVGWLVIAMYLPIFALGSAM